MVPRLAERSPRYVMVLTALAAACSASPIEPATQPEVADDEVATDTDVVADSDSVDDDGPPPTDDGVPGDPEPITRQALLGVYDLSGSEPTYGAYSGQAELRAGAEAGTVQVIHTRRWTDARFEGLRQAQVWEGTLTGDAPPFALRAELAARNFMRAYGGTTRDPSSTPAQLAGTLAPDGATLAVSYAVAGTTSNETWTHTGANGPEPIWRNERRVLPSHDPLSQETRDALFDNYEDFHALEAVLPYVARPEFQAAVHAFVSDRTDFGFLRANPDTVRVIQGVVDVISLAEARLRQRGYAHTLAAKAALFDARAPIYHLSSAGFFADWNGSDEQGWHDHSGDGLLWSGMYLASQALRYLTTGSPEALAHVRRVLDAMFACHAATGDPGQFCRTMRAHVDDGSTAWRRGVAPYEHLDWMPGGNNDMSHGFEIGFTLGWLALEAAGGDDAREQRIREIADTLLEHSSVVGDGATNELRWTLLHYAITGDFSDRLKYETRFAVLEPFLIGEGNGVRYDDHLAMDASGNHLNLLGLLVPYFLARALGHDHQDDYREGLRNYFDELRRVNLGLHQLVAGVIGFDTPPPEVEDALWRLREYPIRKQDFDIDHRLAPGWCMSPWPKLPWKNDWQTNDRTQGLYGYPLFERNPDVSYQWKTDPMWYRGGAGPQVGGNADFLFAYWFGRYTGIITPEM